MALLLRAEKEITVQGPNGPETYTLKMSWQAIAEIEEKTGKSILSIAHGLGAGDMSFTTAAVILAAGVRAGLDPASHIRPLTLEGAGERIVNSGSLKILKALGEFVMVTMTIPDEAKNLEEREKKAGGGA
jgi:hypothetical protein